MKLFTVVKEIKLIRWAKSINKRAALFLCGKLIAVVCQPLKKSPLPLNKKFTRRVNILICFIFGGQLNKKKTTRNTELLQI